MHPLPPYFSRGKGAGLLSFMPKEAACQGGIASSFVGRAKASLIPQGAYLYRGAGAIRLFSLWRNRYREAIDLGRGAPQIRERAGCGCADDPREEPARRASPTILGRIACDA